MPAAERFLFTGSFFITLKVYLNIGKHRSEDGLTPAAKFEKVA